MNLISCFPSTGYFPLDSEYCLTWICLDVLFCTASIMHLCTISVDRYLSLRYPMKFGRNKTRKRVVLKIAFVWLLSFAMGLPLSLMYSAVSMFCWQQNAIFWNTKANVFIFRVVFILFQWFQGFGKWKMCYLLPPLK